MTASWTVASFCTTDQSAAHLVLWDTYYDFAISSGMEQSYIESYVHYYTHIQLDCLYSAVYHADGLFRSHARQASDPQTF